jgi:hypothetical protein
MIKYIFIILIFLLGCVRRDKCSNFREGLFLMKSDSVKNHEFYVKRKINEQIEIQKNGEKNFYILNWISNCSYEIKLNKKRKQTHKLNYIDNIYIIRVEIQKIEADTAFYKSYINANGVEIPAVTGKMILIKEMSVPRSRTEPSLL